MPLTETELLARDATRNIGDELLQAIRDVKAGNAGAQSSASERIKQGIQEAIDHANSTAAQPKKR